MDMPRGAGLKRRAFLILVALVAFWLGGVLEFHYGAFAPSWVNTVLLYRQPQHGLDLAALQDVFRTIQQYYVKPNPNAEKLTEGAASGMVGALGDKFSRYLTPEEFAADNSFLQGTFAGIGTAVVQQNGKLQIDSVIAGTPAARAGLRVGDVITSVNGESTAGWTADQAVNRIRGKAGTHVVLGLQRGTQSFTKDLVREQIVVPSVSTHVFGRVLYVRIFDFGDRTASEFDQALRDGLKGQVDRIVLDLRDNPGGFVDAANDVISEFVSKGTSTILVRRGGGRDVRKVTGDGHAYNAPLVVLINENTASASEITAGAIKDHHRGELIGTKSFGKGSVQQDFKVRDGDLHLTIATWLTPDGHSINQVGITPDQTVTLANADQQYAVDRTPNTFKQDAQLMTALSRLGGAPVGLVDRPVATIETYAGRHI